MSFLKKCLNHGSRAIIWSIVLCIMTLVPFGSLQGKEKTLRVVYTDWYPYTFSHNGKPSGFELEIFQAVIQRMNYSASYVNFPWKRCLENMKSGEADVIISALKTSDREEYILFPATYISVSRTVFFVRNGHNIRYDGKLEQLKNYTIGVIMGFTYGDEFDKANYLHKDEAVDAYTLIMKLIYGRNDIIAENQAVITTRAKDMGFSDRIVPLSPPIHTQRLYVGFSKSNNLQSLCDAFSTKLSAFKNTQEYRAILAKYGLKYDAMVTY